MIRSSAVVCGGFHKPFARIVHRVIFLFAGLTLAMSTARSADKQLLILDDDWSVDSGGYVSEPYLLPFLRSDKVSVLGLTVVTGDFWRQEEAASLLRFLELTGHADTPVYLGAETPLIRTWHSDQTWQRSYGTHPWNGAWNPEKTSHGTYPQDPDRITAPLWGAPGARPAKEDAVRFMTDAVHEHIGAVTIVTGGPLTTIALAVRADPQFARLAEGIVIGGLGVTLDSAGMQGRASFNPMFDPEAAFIVLHAPWRKITIVAPKGPITFDSPDPILTPEIVGLIRTSNPQIADYVVRSHAVGLPMWGIADSAYFLDPKVIVARKLRSVSVEIDHGPNYGKTTSVDGCYPEDADFACVDVVQIDTDAARKDWLANIRRR